MFYLVPCICIRLQSDRSPATSVAGRAALCPSRSSYIRVQLGYFNLYLGLFVMLESVDLKGVLRRVMFSPVFGVAAGGGEARGEADGGWNEGYSAQKTGAASRATSTGFGVSGAGLRPKQWVQ